jgi:hypothetical protein
MMVTVPRLNVLKLYLHKAFCRLFVSPAKLSYESLKLQKHFNKIRTYMCLFIYLFNMRSSDPYKADAHRILNLSCIESIQRSTIIKDNKR